LAFGGRGGAVEGVHSEVAIEGEILAEKVVSHGIVLKGGLRGRRRL
jgi:hypothetical protein